MWYNNANFSTEDTLFYFKLKIVHTTNFVFFVILTDHTQCVPQRLSRQMWEANIDGGQPPKKAAATAIEFVRFWNFKLQETDDTSYCPENKL